RSLRARTPRPPAHVRRPFRERIRRRQRPSRQRLLQDPPRLDLDCLAPRVVREDFVDVVRQEAYRVQCKVVGDDARSARREELDLVMERLSETFREALLIETVSKFVGT